MVSLDTCTSATIIIAWIVVSASMINSNKWILAEERFPFAKGLVFCHMVATFVLSCIGYCLFGADGYPSIDKVKGNIPRTARIFGVLGLITTMSVVLSNVAYMYCSVPFLQICKEANSVMAYFFGVLVTTEKWHTVRVQLLTCVFAGCAVAVHGELHFSTLGLAVQLTHQSFEVAKLQAQAYMVSGGEGNDFKLDPMTFVLCLAPFSAFFTLCGIGVESMYNAIEATDGPKLLERGIENWHFLLLNCLNAFTLNVLSTFVVRRVSAVGFCLCGAVKNIIIIFVSASLMGEAMVLQQVVGYTFALSNVVLYSLSKQINGVFDDGYCSGISILGGIASDSLGFSSRAEASNSADVELENGAGDGPPVGKELE
jgi:hypothetical protein